MNEPITVVTSFSAEGYALYGGEFLSSFAGFWPAEVELLVYAEGCEPFIGRENSLALDLFTQAPDAAAFVERHRNNPEASGRKRVDGHRWKESAVTLGYNYRFDAVRFSRKPFAVQAAMRRRYSGLLFWVDADVVTHRPVTSAFLRGLLPEGTDYCYLGRSTTNSECGFLGYRMPACRPLIDGLADMYRTNMIFAEAEWHDSFLWDIMRGRETCTALRGNDLSRAPRIGDVFSRSILATCMEHRKGAKKYQVKDRKVAR